MLLASPSTASHAQCVSLVFGSVDLSLCLWPQLYIVHSTTFFCASQKQISVMVGGPAVGKAGDCLDWIAGGLEMKELKDSGNPCPL